MRHAAAFLAEANTFNWVLACNHVGVAPLSLDVYATWEKARFGSLLEGLPPRRHVNQWVQRFRAKCRASVWFNPDPERYWNHPTVRAIGDTFPMFPLTIEGLRDGVKKLRAPL